MPMVLGRGRSGEGHRMTTASSCADADRGRKLAVAILHGDFAPRFPSI